MDEKTSFNVLTEHIKDAVKNFPRKYGGQTRKEKMGYRSYDWYKRGDIETWMEKYFGAYKDE